MPVINIEFDKKRLQQDEIESLSKAVHQIVSEVSGIDDVPVYANSSTVIVEAAPIEIFVRMTAQKIIDLEKLTAEVKSRLMQWKADHNFGHPINLSFIPMNWKIEIGI